MAPHASDGKAAMDAAAAGPLTVDGVAALRAKTKLPMGIAAFSCSDMFKSPACFTRPKAKNWAEYITVESKSRMPSVLKNAAQYLKEPGLISLGGGLPSSEYFPFENITIKSRSPAQFSDRTTEPELVLSSTKHDIQDGTSEFDLDIALNYGQSVGYAALLRYVTEHVEIVHNPPYSDWSVELSPGSTSGWDFALRMLVERGDYVLVEEYSFCAALESILAQGGRVASIKMDEEGLLPSSLDEVLTNWDTVARGARKPFVLYTIPSGHNPTAATQSLERRKEIYRVAQKHDLILIEDEPYYYLQMQPYKGPNTPIDPPPATIEEFLKSLLPSYLSMDVDGRVIRLDSFSKVLSPGSRVGFIVGPDQLIERMIRQSETSTQAPSGMSHIILYKLLEEGWGHEGYFKWLIHIRMEYTKRRNSMMDSYEKYLPKSIASWIPPAAGMFSWIQIDWQKHPAVKEGKGHNAIEEMIYLAGIEAGVLACCGSWFLSDNSAGESDMFFRTTFAAAPAEKIDEAIKRFGATLKAQFKLE
ncbi:Aromatic/aminoadipate aminotransferase 1 [Myotisia sp. PD_48]|nr:Aromatic/aminoadipate aminotransferase 1 [Myotisia sp. PD_48]